MGVTGRKGVRPPRRGVHIADIRSLALSVLRLVLCVSQRVFFTERRQRRGRRFQRASTETKNRPDALHDNRTALLSLTLCPARDSRRRFYLHANALGERPGEGRGQCPVWSAVLEKIMTRADIQTVISKKSSETTKTATPPQEKGRPPRFTRLKPQVSGSVYRKRTRIPTLFDE